jgi:hypothetical protein
MAVPKVVLQDLFTGIYLTGVLANGVLGGVMARASTRPAVQGYLMAQHLEASHGRGTAWG